MIKIISRIMNLSKKQKKYLVIGNILNFFENMMIFVPFMLLFYFLRLYTLAELTSQNVLVVSVVMVLSIVLRGVLRRIVDQLHSIHGLSIFAEMRMRFVEHLKKLPLGYFSDDHMGDITSVLTTDMFFMENNAMTFLGQLVAAVTSIILSAICIFVFNLWMGLAYIFIILISFFSIGLLDKRNKQFGGRRQKQFGIIASSVVQFVQGMATVKAFGMNDEDNVDLKQVFLDSREYAIEFERKYFLPRILADLNVNWGIALIIAIDLILYYFFAYPLDYCLGFLIFSSVSLNALQVVISAVPRFDILDVGLNRYYEIMNVEEIEDNEEIYIPKTHNIKFQDVSFSYDKKEILHQISFDIKEHSMTALVGPSGSGKSTITNLLARFWDVKSGNITIDGIDIKKMSLDSLLSQISMVFQNVYLFKDTIANNIAFGVENAQREDIIYAAQKARCHDFIMNLPQGYDTMIGESGSTLSGGEKQRISIARAMLKNAPIILLDEATSSVDPENEIYIQQAIDALVKDKTLIVIAHRLTSIKNADKIIVIEDGRILEEGTHVELLENQGTYYKMWNC